jgi:hypothetical protein
VKKSMLVVAAAAGLLALTPAASAKEITSAKLCGQEGCATIPKAKASLFLQQLHGEGEGVSTGQTVESYYVLRLGVGRDNRGKEIIFDVFYLPTANVLRITGDGRWNEPWMRVTDAQAAALRALAPKVAPYAKPRPAVTVGKTRVGATPYLGLVGPLQARPIPARTGKSTTIALRWPKGTPWSQETSLVYFAAVNLVCRNDGCYGVPGAVAADVERDLARR